MEIFEAKTATIQLIEPQILLCTMKRNAEMDMDALTENYEASKRLTENGRFVSLVDARPHAVLIGEAKKAATNPQLYTKVIAQAVIITSLTKRLLVNFILSFKKLNIGIEIKMFNNYDDALAWARQKRFDEQVALGLQKYREQKSGS